jgi:hypothetical protein
MKRKFIAVQDLIHRKRSDRIVDLVLNAMVGAPVEVACGARSAAVAAGLHVPKESFSQDYERVLILDVLTRISELWEGNGL